MIFEWDEKKSASNKLKHGIDFETARSLWDDPFRVEIQTSFPDENRSVLISRIGNKIWTSIFTVREGSIRIISVRRARKREAMLYESKENG
jgi:uncharacterized protein